MALSGHHWRFLLIYESVVPALFNFVLNGAIAWSLFRSAPFVPLWGPSSIAGDTLVTSFLLPLLSCIIITWLIQRGVQRGELRPLIVSPLPGWQTRLCQVGPIQRAILLGVLGVVIFGVPVAVLLERLGVTALTFPGFVLFKAAYAALLAAAVCPLIAWLAFASPSPERAISSTSNSGS